MTSYKPLDLQSASKEELTTYRETVKSILQDVAEYINHAKKDEPNFKPLNISSVLDHTRWGMDKVTPKSTRGSSGIEIKHNNEKVPNNQGDVVKKRDIVTYLQYELKKIANKTPSKEDKANAKTLIGVLNYVSYQAQDKIMETISIDFLEKIKIKAEKLEEDDKNTICEKVDSIKDNVLKYGLDKGNHHFTTSDIGKNFLETKKLYKDLKNLINNIGQDYNLKVDDALDHLQRSRDSFENKACNNFNNPTIITDARVAHAGAKVALSTASVVSGAAATSMAAAAVAFPPAAVGAAICGTISGVTGFTGLAVDTVNVLSNYARFEMKPRTSEKFSISLGGLGILLHGANLPAVQQLFTTSTNVLSTFGITGDVTTVGNEFRRENTVDFKDQLNKITSRPNASTGTFPTKYEDYNNVAP